MYLGDGNNYYEKLFVFNEKQSNKHCNNENKLFWG